MRIGIDARVLEKKMTGISRCLACILKYVLEIDRDNEYFLFSMGNLPKYVEDFKVIPTGENRLIPEKAYSLIWLNFVLPKYLRKHNIDLFLSPRSLLPMNIKCKSMVIVPDTLTKINEDYFPFFFRQYVNIVKPRVIKKSTAIIAISQNSKRDIIKFYRVPEDKIKVIYLAAGENFCPRNLTPKQRKYFREKYNLPDEFILYVGVIENRKNIMGILKIGDVLQKHKRDIKIVLIGRPGFGFRQIYREIKKRDHVYHLNYVGDEDLPYIYNLAKIFLFPSFYEGFGLPPLEAMQSGIPVVTSNTSSLPEVLGNGGILLDPYNYEGFAQNIMKLMEDKNFYSKMREKGTNQAKKFAWKKTAKEVINAIKVLDEENEK